jgi:chromosome segregation ATPase
MKELKSQVQSCDANLREIERKCTEAFIMVWWLSETATLRYVAEHTLRVELTEAVAKIQEREGVLFSLKLEREKTPEKESPYMQRETIRMHKELAFWEEERLHLAAKKERFEIQVKEISTLLRHLQIDLKTAEGRLQQVDAKAAEVAKAQSGLAVTKESWLLEKSALEAAAAESELRYKHAEQELHATQEVLQTLKIQTQEAEAREDAVQAERAKLEEELKKHLEAVHVLAEALQSQVTLSFPANGRHKFSHNRVRSSSGPSNSGLLLLTKAIYSLFNSMIIETSRNNVINNKNS